MTRSVPKAIFKSREFRGAFKLAEEFREKKPTRARVVKVNVPRTLMVMGHVEFIGYRTTHGNELVLYKHDFAPGSRPQLAAGPKRNQLFIIGGRYRVTDRGIVDLDARAREIDEPQHGEDLREVNPTQKIVSAPMGAISTGRGKIAHHWHAVMLDEDGNPARVLCGRAKPEHILADFSMYNEKPVSCPTCTQRLTRMKLTE